MTDKERVLLCAQIAGVTGFWSETWDVFFMSDKYDSNLKFQEDAVWNPLARPQDAMPLLRFVEPTQQYADHEDECVTSGESYLLDAQDPADVDKFVEGMCRDIVEQVIYQYHQDAKAVEQRRQIEEERRQLKELQDACGHVYETVEYCADGRRVKCRKCGSENIDSTPIDGAWWIGLRLRGGGEPEPATGYRRVPVAPFPEYNPCPIQFPFPYFSWGTISSVVFFKESSGNESHGLCPLVREQTVMCGNAPPSFAPGALAHWARRR